MNIPIEEKSKLYPYVTESIVPTIAVTLIILGKLFLGESSGVFDFYIIPWLVLLSFVPRKNVDVLLQTVGLNLNTKRKQIIALVSIPVGLLFGFLLVKLATSGLTFFTVSTFPWASTQLSTALLSTSSVSRNFVVFGVVGIFEELLSLLFGKGIANFIYKKWGGNPITVSIIGLLLGRLVLVSQHWFSYDGLANPTLYISAFLFFFFFTLLGVLFGLWMVGFKVGDDFEDLGYLPVLAVPMIMSHFMFDFVMSNLTIATDVILNTFMPTLLNLNDGVMVLLNLI